MILTVILFIRTSNCEVYFFGGGTYRNGCNSCTVVQCQQRERSRVDVLMVEQCTRYTLHGTRYTEHGTRYMGVPGEPPADHRSNE